MRWEVRSGAVAKEATVERPCPAGGMCGDLLRIESVYLQNASLYWSVLHDEYKYC